VLHRGSGKSKSQILWHQDSRSREFRISDRRTEGGEFKSTRVSGNRHIGVWSLEIKIVDIASSDFPIGRAPMKGDKVND